MQIAICLIILFRGVILNRAFGIICQVHLHKYVFVFFSTGSICDVLLFDVKIYYTYTYCSQHATTILEFQEGILKLLSNAKDFFSLTSQLFGLFFKFQLALN